MNKIRKILALSAIIFISVLNAFAAPDLPIVNLLGEDYYVYTIKKGDSLFAVAREYDWDYDKLMNLNPHAIAPLNKGMKIYYPAPKSLAESEGEGSINVDSNVYANVNDAAQLPLTHKIKRGDTVFGISKMYNVPIDVIYSLNPGSRIGIKEGDTLLLSNSDVEDKGLSSEFYVIKSGDTLYAIAKKYNTTVAEIMKKNPGVSERNFRAGATIKLPESGSGVKTTKKSVEREQLTSFSTYKVEKKDTWESISEKTGVDKENILKANVDSGDKPKNNSIISIPNIETTTEELTLIEEDPRELTQEGLSEIYEDVHGLSENYQVSTVKVAILLAEPNSRKDLEFTRGFMAALHTMKDKEDKIDIKVWNMNDQSAELLSELSDLNPDLILLTTDKGISDSLAEYAEVSQTPMVNIFDVKNDLYTTNPYILQLLTPSNYFNEEIANRIVNDYADAKVIFIGEDPTDQLGAILKDGKWNPRNVSSLSISEIAEIPFKENESYLIYAFPSKKDEVTELLNAVKEEKEKHLMSDITVVGRPSWVVYEDSSLGTKFYDCNVMIPSRFYYDKNCTGSKMFEMYYKSLFNRNPAKSYPMYAVMGYDIAEYFIPALIEANKDLNALKDYNEGVQSDFSFVRPANWSGLMNSLVYLVRYTPYNTIEKLVVK